MALMERCHQRPIKLNAGRLRFKLKEVKFRGTIISDYGMKPDPEKVAAITQTPTLQNKPALLRFIGMVNYLSPFCLNLSSARVDPGLCTIFMVHGSRKSLQQGETNDFIRPSLSLL